MVFVRTRLLGTLQVGRTALDQALQAGYSEVVQALISASNTSKNVN